MPAYARADTWETAHYAGSILVAYANMLPVVHRGAMGGIPMLYGCLAPSHLTQLGTKGWPKMGMQKCNKSLTLPKPKENPRLGSALGAACCTASAALATGCAALATGSGAAGLGCRLASCCCCCCCCWLCRSATPTSEEHRNWAQGQQLGS